MKADKYISTRSGVNGFSFANLGLFTGFGNGIIGAVYSLILLDILGSAAVVGIYSSVYSAFCLLITLFIGEFMRFFSKAKLFYASLISIFICYIMLSFSIKPGTFVALDFFTAVPLAFIGMLIPLFMADFAGREGLAKMNGRYHFWLNAGALFAPMIAMQIADFAGNRAAFGASGVMYLCAWAMFKRYGIVQEDKKIRKVSPRRTIRSVMRGVRAYFRNKEFARAYFVNVGYYAMKSLRLLYMPIIVIESGFSKDVLGLVLTIGILPYVILAEPIGALAKRYGRRATTLGLAFGFLSFSACAAALCFAKGYAMLSLFVIWQISGAFQETLHNMIFFDAASKAENARFYGIFSTSGGLTYFITPLVGAAFIFVLGTTRAAWVAAAIIGVLSTFVLLSKHRK